MIDVSHMILMDVDAQELTRYFLTNFWPPGFLYWQSFPHSTQNRIFQYSSKLDLFRTSSAIVFRNHEPVLSKYQILHNVFLQLLALLPIDVNRYTALSILKFILVYFSPFKITTIWEKIAMMNRVREKSFGILRTYYIII